MIRGWVAIRLLNLLARVLAAAPAAAAPAPAADDAMVIEIQQGNGRSGQQVLWGKLCTDLLWQRLNVHLRQVGYSCQCRIYQKCW
jgi:hypothetical protein